MSRPLARVATWCLVAVVTFVAGLAVAPTAPAAADDAEGGQVADRPGRLLVVSIPGLTWADVHSEELPNLDAFFEGAAMANMAPRGVSPRETPAGAYLTISSGSRATGDPGSDGQVLGVDEESSGSTAGEIFARRTGHEPSGPFVSLSWPNLLSVNEDHPYVTRLGLLTETLAEAGVASAVIGNADGVETIGPSYERQVGLALADPEGVVPDGDLGTDLLVADPNQPFGVRQDTAAVEESFAGLWSDAGPDDADPGGGVVLVEASDAARVLRYRTTVESRRYRELWSGALRTSDVLFGRLMDHVDLERDRVLVVAPYNRAGDRDLTVAALGGAGIEAGYLRSASTQRSGLLTLVDVAPTILDSLGVARPDQMEGRPAVVVPSSDDVGNRIDRLIKINRASRFREQLLTPTTTAVIVILAAAVALAMLAHTNRWGDRARRLIAVLALGGLSMMPMSFVARGFALEDLGIGFYWTFITLAGLALTLAALGAEHLWDRRRVALGIVLTAVVVVIVADVVTGSRLSLSAAFGYSPTGNSRLYGVSNYGYGQLAAAVCLLAAGLASLRPDRWGKLAGVGLMVGLTVVLGVPVWGSDVGGVLAFTPAVLVFALVASGRRIRVRTVLLAGLATAGAILLFGLLDLARPPSDRAHLGRLFERVINEGAEPLVNIVERKLLANLNVSTSSLWVVAIPIGLVLWTYVARYRDRPYHRMRTMLPALPAGLLALVVAAVLGTLLNDSGAIVGGVASLVLSTALVVELLDLDRRGAPHGPAGPVEPDPPPDDEPEIVAPVRADDALPG